jgi:starch phosphorylase
MYRLLAEDSDGALMQRKKACKRILFEEVADQNGEIYDENILTIVFAKRFAGYKRAQLLLADPERFDRLVKNKEKPVQIIWAGKPYPMDYENIAVFDRIVHLSKQYYNCSTLVGYELKLSKLLKAGADVWLNVPRLTREASGTSGMTAAMNGAVNLSIPDGWYPEFAKDGENGFVIPPADPALPDHRIDDLDAASLYDQLENRVLPMYYEQPGQWMNIMKNSMTDIIPAFDSKRMADEYYRKMYIPRNRVASMLHPMPTNDLVR